jgi:hypothetical protein
MRNDKFPKPLKPRIAPKDFHVGGDEEAFEVAEDLCA